MKMLWGELCSHEVSNTAVLINEEMGEKKRMKPTETNTTIELFKIQTCEK